MELLFWEEEMSDPILDPLQPIHPMAEPSMTPSDMGRKGGQSRSKRKLQAAKKNIVKAQDKLKEKRKKRK